MLKTIDEACDFIAEWCQETGNHAGQPLVCDFAVPDCVVRLNERVGDLWRSAKRLPGPFLEYAAPFLGVLGGFFVLLIGGNIATNWILLRMVEDDFYNQFFR